MRRIGLIGAFITLLGGGPSAAGVIDHVLLAVPQLEPAAAELQARTGIRTVYGGAHVSGGTANRLAWLGPGRYLELIGPAPGAAPVEEGAELARLAAPLPFGFAIRVADAEAEAARLKAAGLKVSSVQAGGRTTPQGVRLSWKAFEIEDASFCSLAPFFIQWGDGVAHPSTTSPGGAELVRLRVFHPDAKGLAKLYAAIGAPVRPEAGPARIELTLKGPKGEATFAGAPSCAN